MYRLEGKIRSKWVLSQGSYQSYEEALQRKEELEKLGHKIRIVKTGF